MKKVILLVFLIASSFIIIINSHAVYAQDSNFNTNITGITTNSSWQYTEDGLLGKANNSENIFLETTQYLEDFSLSCDITFIDADIAGYSLRYCDSGYIEVSLNNETNCVVVNGVGPAVANSYFYKLLSTNIEDGQTYNLLISVYGNMVDVYVDNELQLTVPMNNNVPKKGILKFWINSGSAIYQNVILGDPIKENEYNKDKYKFLTNMTGSYAVPEVWEFVDGGIEGKADKVDPLKHNMFMWFDGTESDFCIIGDITFNDAEIAGFRLRDGEDAKGVEVAISLEDGQVTLGGYGTEFVFCKLNYPIEPGKTYQLGAVLEGNIIKVYFQNRLIIESEQHDLVSKNGRMALWVHQGSATFQNVNYYSLNNLPENLGGGLPGEVDDSSDVVNFISATNKSYDTPLNIILMVALSASIVSLILFDVVFIFKHKEK